MTFVPAYPAIAEAWSKASEERIRNGSGYDDHCLAKAPAGTL
jgi:hypothetical protein